VQCSMADPTLLALTLLSSQSTLANLYAFAPTDPPSQKPQTRWASDGAETVTNSSMTLASIQPESSLASLENSQPINSQFLSFLPSNLEDAPQTGSQLYVQRLASLKEGILYTRLPANSFREAWSQAFVKPTYQQWRKLLHTEARAVARGQGNQSLSIMVGDSLSMWFPANRMPRNQLWLNQGISGDTTWNILSRLSSFSETRPDQIYVMAGVNDLKMGATDSEVLWNLQRIIRQLRANHPNAKVIVQSILPTRSAAIPHQRIARINRRLERIAQREGGSYIDLYSRFVGEDGQLLSTYTTDGVHLNAAGYAAWQNAIRRSEVRIAQAPKV
jgi:lysophospholipase L1-like esterase